jgi:hypothetical protein
LVKGFAPVPGPTTVTQLELQIAACQIVARCIAEDMLQRLFNGNIPPVLSNGND